MDTKDIHTYPELFEQLKAIPSNRFYHWIQERWRGKDKQESCLRMFSSMNLIHKIEAFRRCNGNFNRRTLNFETTLRDAFYDSSDNPVMLNDKGDASDLTCVDREDSNHLLVTTSKNLRTIGVNKLDISSIVTYFKEYEDDGYRMTLCICVPSVEDLHKIATQANATSSKIVEYIESAVIVDQNDLCRAFHRFRDRYDGVSLEEALRSDRSECELRLRIHQTATVAKTLRFKREGVKNMVCGQMPRSGKSYVIAGCIAADSAHKETCRYLVITLAPKETLSQLTQTFKRLKDFTVLTLTPHTRARELGPRSIVVCSKQFLQGKLEDKKKGWCSRLSFDMRFVDESHFGGTTTLAKRTLDCYGGNCFTMHITATYSKPVNRFSIPRHLWITWDMQDVQWCRDGNRPALEARHGDEMRAELRRYSDRDLAEEYSDCPELTVLTMRLTAKTVLPERGPYGWSSGACLLLKQGVEDGRRVVQSEFQNPKETLKMWRLIFGKYDTFGVPSENYPRSVVFMKRIEDICKNPVTASRWQPDDNEPLLILAFLPKDNIAALSAATKELLTTHKVIPDYDIVCINSKVTPNDPKGVVKEAYMKAKNLGKRGVLVLSGSQCSLGVSLEQCDVVLMLNRTCQYDLWYQQVMRCMTAHPGKRRGFVVDMHVQRAITMSASMAANVQTQMNPKEGMLFLFKERLLNLNPDHWMPCFGLTSSKLDSMVEHAYKGFMANACDALNHTLDRIRCKEISLDEKTLTRFAKLFDRDAKKSSKPPEHELQPGIEVVRVEVEKDLEEIEKVVNAAEETDVERDAANDARRLMDVFLRIVPLLSILTIDNDTTTVETMWRSVADDKCLNIMLYSQTRQWWGAGLTQTIFDNLMKMYVKNVSQDPEIAQLVRTIKDLFVANKGNRKELSKLIDSYIIPEATERQENAEVTTPHRLRQKMLDVVPPEFWTSPQKVLEPCAGKGGFLIDIVDRFMDGLSELIADEHERYRVIVEECLYFGDINPVNIYICKLLLNAHGETRYRLNVFEGDTLSLNVRKEWGLDTYSVIMNPPYSTDPSRQDACPLFHKFVDKFIDGGRLMCAVIPSRYFSGGKGLVTFRRSMMNRKDIVSITHEDNASKWFGRDVEIKGGVHFFLKDAQRKGTCDFNGSPYNLSKYDIVVKPKYHPLIDVTRTLPSVGSLYCPSSYFKVRTNDSRLLTEGNVKCFVSKKKSVDTRTMMLKDFKFDENDRFWKVITPRAAHKAFSGFGELLVASPDEIYTDSYIGFRVKNKAEAKSLQSYLRTRFANYMLGSRKVSQDICASTCAWIPLVPLDREWTDEQVCEHLSIDRSLYESDR
jgi:hypothetical protein